MDALFVITWLVKTNSRRAFYRKKLAKSSSATNMFSKHVCCKQTCRHEWWHCCLGNIYISCKNCPRNDMGYHMSGVTHSLAGQFHAMQTCNALTLTQLTNQKLQGKCSEVTVIFRQTVSWYNRDDKMYIFCITMMFSSRAMPLVVCRSPHTVCSLCQFHVNSLVYRVWSSTRVGPWTHPLPSLYSWPGEPRKVLWP